MIIEVKNISKKYRGVPVLKNISMKVSSGNIYGLVGQNGSGKTMLLRTIAGLIVPSSGDVEVDGKKLHTDISFLPKMGILIETPAFIDYLSGLENLKLLAEIQKVTSENKIRECMEMFGLGPNLKSPVRKYSLGMKQKLGIIQAIMENPNIVILDEPFNALDEESVLKLQKLLKTFKDEGKLIIVTSHHKDDILPIYDFVYHMNDGQLELV